MEKGKDREGTSAGRSRREGHLKGEGLFLNNPLPAGVDDRSSKKKEGVTIRRKIIYLIGKGWESLIGGIKDCYRGGPSLIREESVERSKQKRDATPTHKASRDWLQGEITRRKAFLTGVPNTIWGEGPLSRKNLFSIIGNQDDVLSRKTSKRSLLKGWWTRARFEKKGLALTRKGDSM